MSLYTAMKNMRRRTVESVFQKTGLSEITVDQEFDDMNGNVHEVLQDLNECGAALSAVLKAQKVFFGEARDLTAVVHQIYERSINEKDLWPEETNKLNHAQAASLWKEKWDKLHDVTRSSSAIVCCDEALDPIKDTINTCVPTLEQDTRDRGVILMDFDSHRRRLKGYEAKRDAGGINNTAAGFELQNDLAKYQAKVQASGEEYDRLNDKLKNEMMSTKESHDELIETMLITFVTAQVHLFSKVAKELDEILRFFPAAQVREIRSRIDGYESQGGVFMDVKEKSTTRKVYEVAVGKSVISDFKKQSSASDTVEGVILPQEIKPSMASAVIHNSANNNNSNHHHHHNDSSSVQGVNMMKAGGGGIKKAGTPPPAATTANSTTSNSSSGGGDGKKVIAMFGYKAGADDELGFEKGAVIQVIDDTSDAGWWRGRINNKEGIFPANYVELLPPIAPVVATAVAIKPTSISPSKPLMRQLPQQETHVPMATVFKTPPPAATSSSSSSSSMLPSSVNKARPNASTSTTTPSSVAAVTRTAPAPRATPPPAAISAVPLTRTAPPPQKVISSTPAIVSAPRARAPPPAAVTKSPPRKQVIALYAYEAQEDGELSFQKGHTIEVLEDSDPGWWKGRHMVDSSIGIFPANYVKLTK